MPSVETNAPVEAEINVTTEAPVEVEINVATEAPVIDVQIDGYLRSEMFVVDVSFKHVPDSGYPGTFRWEFSATANEIANAVTRGKKIVGHLVSAIGSSPNFLELLFDGISETDDIISATFKAITTTGITCYSVSGNSKIATVETVPFSGGGGGGAVNSVNGQTGDVVLTAQDVGALPDTTVIPTKTSDLTNNSGFVSNSAGNAYRAASIPMGHLDSSSTATVMTATVSGIAELRDGVFVWLHNGVITSASGVTLNINSLGAKPIYNSLAGTVVTTTFAKAATYLFVYNSTRVSGGCWDMVYGYYTNTTYTPVKLGFGYATCSTAEATAAKTAALSSYTLTTGGIVAVKFTNAVPAGATLNINSRGAKAIYYKGSPITAGVIKAGDTVTMIYSTYYHVLSIDRDVDTLPPSPSDDNPRMNGSTSPGSSTDYARADHVHPSDTGKLGVDDSAEMVTMTASGSTVTCFKSFAQIYLLFSTQKKTYFVLAASQTDYQLFTIDRVDGGNQTIYLSSIVGGVLSQIVLTPGGSSTMTGTLSTIDLNLQSASGVSF